MKLTDIKLNPANPRFIRDDSFKLLVKSIDEFPKMMELRPIVIDDDGIIVGGNMRYRALKELGKTEIPDSWIKKAKDFTPEELRRFIVQDNVGFGEWDYDALANEYDIEELEEWGLEVPISKEEAPKDDKPDKIITCPECGHEFNAIQSKVAGDKQAV